MIVNPGSGPVSAGEAWTNTYEQALSTAKAWLDQMHPEGMTDAPWGIEFEEGADRNYWANRWHVLTDGGAGTRIATFEYSEHAEAFIERCGPRPKAAAEHGMGAK